MPVEDAHRIYSGDRPSFAALLMGIPHAVETELIRHPCRRPICDRLAARHQRPDAFAPGNRAIAPKTAAWFDERTDELFLSAIMAPRSGVRAAR
jgi:hypothetical protein